MKSAWSRVSRRKKKPLTELHSKRSCRWSR
jgi:hypothetical protein